MNNSARPSPKGTDLTQFERAMNTNAYSISTPLKVRYYLVVVAAPLRLIRSEKGGERGVRPAIHLVWKQMNTCFSCVCAPDETIRHRGPGIDWRVAP